MDKSRYEIVNMLQEYWNMLSWKGDHHTNGIYFNQQYGYMVERTYAIRIEHSEPAPSVFYVPGEVSETEEDEIYTSFPFDNMTKKPNKFHLLFNGKSLNEDSLDELFVVDEISECRLPISPLRMLLGKVSKKRERDRSWLLLEVKGGEADATLVTKTNRETVTIKGNFQEEGMKKMVCIVNANNLFHALNLFSLSETLFFTVTRDKIKLNYGKSKPKMEAIISLPKETIQREILRFRKE